MRILFLDFDGVLHPLGLQLHESRQINGKPVARLIKVDFFCWVPLLAELLAEHPDVYIVAHTSWRDSHTAAALAAYLGPLQGRVLGATRSEVSKYPSILEWLAANPSVTSYRILDDAVQEFPQDPTVGEFIACDYRTGISDSSVNEALLHWLRATRP